MRRALLMATALATLSGCSQLEDILSGDTKLEAHSLDVGREAIGFGPFEDAWVIE